MQHRDCALELRAGRRHARGGEVDLAELLRLAARSLRRRYGSAKEKNGKDYRQKHVGQPHHTPPRMNGQPSPSARVPDRIIPTPASFHEDRSSARLTIETILC